MAVKRRPYDLIYLLTFQFAIAVLMFYSAAILLVLGFDGTEQELIDELGPNAFDLFVDNAQTVFLAVGAVLAFMFGLLMIEIWGMMKRKHWSYPFGALLSVLIVITNLTAITVLGTENAQTLVRFGICVVLPFLVVYYLRRPDIADYFLKK